ncbi:MAG TPA: hypothetical protein VGK24_05750 [Candidatus Angelobacter sp.]|jgi:hypothetical protein
MKKIISLLLLVVASVGLCSTGFAQNLPVVNRSFDSGVFYAPAYAFGVNQLVSPLRVAVGTASGAGTITLQFGEVDLADGRKTFPFTGVTTFPPITIGTGAVVETVTPSSASCSTPQILNTCQITATFTNAHGQGDFIASGDNGIQEAINDAASFGGGAVFWIIDPGAVTLATGAANTNLGAVNIPARSVVMGASARVTVTIATCTGGWSLGISSGTEFTAANTTLTAGTTTDSSTGGTTFITGTAGVPIAHCTTANASAGAIHARVWGYKQVAPAF